MKYIRLDSPASRVECVIAEACRRAGGIEAFGDRLAEAINSKNLKVAVDAGVFLVKLVIAAEHLRTEHELRMLEMLNRETVRSHKG